MKTYHSLSSIYANLLALTSTHPSLAKSFHCLGTESDSFLMVIMRIHNICGEVKSSPLNNGFQGYIG